MWPGPATGIIFESVEFRGPTNKRRLRYGSAAKHLRWRAADQFREAGIATGTGREDPM